MIRIHSAKQVQIPKSTQETPFATWVRVSVTSALLRPRSPPATVFRCAVYLHTQVGSLDFVVRLLYRSTALYLLAAVHCSLLLLFLKNHCFCKIIASAKSLLCKFIFLLLLTCRMMFVVCVRSDHKCAFVDLVTIDVVSGRPNTD